jgi:hypothetical protein
MEIEIIEFHVMYRLIVSLYLFARCTFCIAIYVLYRARMSITSSWRLNTIQSRASQLRLEFRLESGVYRRQPIRCGVDPSDSCSDASDLILNGNRRVFYLI